MRNIFFMALIGVALVLGVLYIVPETEILSLITSVGVFITIFLAAGAKVSAEAAALRVEQVERKTELSIQKSVENQSLLQETKEVVNLTHDAVNSQAELLRKAEKVVTLQEGEAIGREKEKDEQAIRDEHGKT